MSKPHTKALFIFLFLFALAAGLRVWGLDRDSPSVDILPDDATWTDEGTLALPATEAVRGDAALGGSSALVAGSHPLYDLMLYEAFRGFGPGRTQARAVSVILGLVGLLALGGLGKMLWSVRGSLLALFFGAIGFFSIAFDRVVLAEGPTVALLASLAYFGVTAQSALGALVVGIGLGLLAVGVKLYALALFPALAALYALRRRRLLFPFLLGCAVVLVAWRLFWVPQVPSYLGYYVEDRLTEPQMGLAPPSNVLLQAFFAGLSGYFFPYQIALLFFACLEVMAVLLSPRRWLDEAPDLLVLALVWLPISLALPSFFRYIPTGYFMPGFPALVILAIGGIRRLLDGKPFPSSSRWLRFAVGLGVGCFFLFQAAPPLPLFGKLAVWIPILGLPLPLLFYWLTSRASPGWGWSQITRTRILVGLLVFHSLFQGGLYWVGVVRSGSDVSRIASTLAADLPPNAILTGRMAGSVALMSDQRAVSMYHQIDSQFVEGLAKQGPVWVLILEGDEKLVTPAVQARLSNASVFPVGYSQEVRYLTVWRYGN